MKASVMFARCVALVAVVTLTAGCGDKPSPPSSPPVDPGAGSDRRTRTPPFGEKEGYYHRPSGVGFLYPDGWNVLGVRDQGPVTSLGLRKNEGGIEVTLYWTEPDQPIDSRTVGDVEWSGLRALYGDKVGKPESITVGTQTGFRLPIRGGPVGEADPTLSGVVYVFAVKSEKDWWKIKLRATIRGKEKLAEVEKLLNNYRW
jgi:hypothetical protein